MREVTEVCSVNYASHEKRRECLLSSDAHAVLLAIPPNEQLAHRLGQFFAAILTRSKGDVTRDDSQGDF